MSAKYPRVHGVFQGRGEKTLRVAFVNRQRAELAAHHARSLSANVVELIPISEHEDIVADAKTAERERLIAIVRSINPCDVENSRPTFASATLRHVLSKLCEVPQ